MYSYMSIHYTGEITPVVQQSNEVLLSQSGKLLQYSHITFVVYEVAFAIIYCKVLIKYIHLNVPIHVHYTGEITPVVQQSNEVQLSQSGKPYDLCSV